jgi:hypothetical protein
MDDAAGTAGCTWDARAGGGGGMDDAAGGGVYVGRARRGLVASAPAPTGYFSAPLSGLDLPVFAVALAHGTVG